MVEPQQAMLLVVLQNVALMGLTLGLFWGGVLVARRLGSKRGYSPSALGISRPKGGVFTGILLGGLVGIGTLVASVPLNGLSALLLERLGYPARSTVQEPLLRGLEDWVSRNPGVAIPAIVFVVVIFGPAVEELVFRGAIFGGLYGLGRFLTGKVSGRIPGRAADATLFFLAALLSSAFFALLHLEPVLLAALLVLAVSLCALLRWTGSLLPSFVAHATFNSFAVLAVVLSGLDVLKLPL